jgi:glycosyltransferase involved in cell wall biosynthesis
LKLASPLDRPRRIFFVENGIGYGGAIICMRHLVRSLDRARYEPIVVTGRAGGPYDDIGNEAIWLHIRDRWIDVPGVQARVARVDWLHHIWGARWLVNQVLARIDDIANFLPFFLRITLAIKRFHPVLIHANNEPQCNRAALLAGKLLRVPVVCHVRGDQRGSHMMRRFYSLPDHFIPVSRWISESIGRLGVPAAERTCVYDGIELDKLDHDASGKDFRQRYGVPPDAFAVGLVGLLIPWKGQRLFLEAAKLLLRDIPDLWLVMVGGTPAECHAYEAELRQEGARPEYRERVVFTGHVTAMSSAYNGLDVVVSASIDPEPLGTVIIESLALGRPLVAPDHGGAAEMIEHGKTGLLFEPGNAAALAQAIKWLFSDPALRQALSESAREKAVATFSIDEHCRRVTEIYDLVLQRTAEVKLPKSRN